MRAESSTARIFLSIGLCESAAVLTPKAVAVQPLGGVPALKSVTRAAGYNPSPALSALLAVK
jgi:hypothetical protein